MEDQQPYNLIFSDFVILESGLNILNNYITSLELETKEKYKRLVMIKELAKKRLKTSVIDDVTISALIKETNEFYNSKKKQEKSKIVKSFKDIFIEDTYAFDQEMIKCNYIFNNSIIYVDSIKDIQNTRHIFSNAIDKPKMFMTQFNLVKYFLLQNPNFKTKFQNKIDGLEITSLGSLQGTSVEVCVLGMLMLNEEGRIQMQDNTKIVNVDISEMQEWGRGYFTPGCVILCQGAFKNDVLKAKLIMHPPPVFNKFHFNERYEKDYFGAISKAFKNGADDKEVLFGGITGMGMSSVSQSGKGSNNKTNISISSKPEENFLLNFLNRDLTTNKVLYPKNVECNVNLNIETMIKGNYNQELTDKLFRTSSEVLSDEFFIVISNPDLSNSNVLLAIEKIITGYESNSTAIVPFMIVFLGNFLPESSYQCFKTYAQCFDNLANILLKNSMIVKNSYIVFIPGPDEFSLFSGFPKHPIIETVINPLKKKIPNIISATNPCRFSIFGKEIVIFRDNLNKKLSRNSIVKCDINNNKEYYVHTVLSQGSLAPVDLNVTPRVWHLAHSMMILPLPDILILADAVEDFVIPISDLSVANPGNFTKDYSFNLVFPLKNLVEPCKVNLL
jgi:hypothetical protein